MTDPTTQPDESRLRRLLDGTLSEGEQAAVMAQVETDPAWQAALERLVADEASWQAVAAHLQEPPVVADAVLARAMESVGTRGSMSDDASLYVSESRIIDGDWTLGFLEPSSDPAALGRLGKYEVQQVVGRGGMGIVLKAFDPKLQRMVAIKVLAPHLAASPEARQRIVREARAAAAVTHENIVTIHAVEDDGPVPYLVMQHVEGESLQDRLGREGPFELKELLRTALQVARGLQAAHAKGLVHRDVKPANILLEQGTGRVRITDFGLARVVDETSASSGTIAGTPQYMAPEQARGEPADHRADLFSLGTVMYALGAGHSPFCAETTMGVLKRVCERTPRPLSEVNPDVPEWLSVVIETLHAKRPRRRYQSAGEVADLLEKILAQLEHPAAVPGLSALVRHRCRRRLIVPRVAVLVMALGAMGVVGMSVSGWWPFTAGPVVAISPSEGADTPAPGSHNGGAIDKYPPLRGQWNEPLFGTVVLHHGPITGPEPVPVTGTFLDGRGEIRGTYDPQMREFEWDWSERFAGGGKMTGQGQATLGADGKTLTGQYRFTGQDYRYDWDARLELRTQP